MPKTRRPKAEDVAQCAVFPGISKESLLQQVRDARDVLAFATRIRPISTGLDVPRPTREEVNRAVENALKDLRKILKQSGRRQPTRTELEDLRFTLRRDVKALFETAAIDGDAIAANLANTPILARGDGSQHFALMLNNQVAAQMIFMNTRGEEIAKLILIIDVIIEVIGLILGLIGLKFPKPDGAKLAGSFAELWKKEGFREAIKKLLKALKDRDATAILAALNALRSLGALGEVLAAYFANLDWIDYAIAIGKFLAWLVLALGTGGAAALAKVATALISIVEILGKVKQIDKLDC